MWYHQQMEHKTFSSSVFPKITFQKWSNHFQSRVSSHMNHAVDAFLLCWTNFNYSAITRFCGWFFHVFRHFHFDVLQIEATHGAKDLSTVLRPPMQEGFRGWKVMSGTVVKIPMDIENNLQRSVRCKRQVNVHNFPRFRHRRSSILNCSIWHCMPA